MYAVLVLLVPSSLLNRYEDEIVTVLWIKFYSFRSLHFIVYFLRAVTSISDTVFADREQSRVFCFVDVCIQCTVHRSYSHTHI